MKQSEAEFMNVATDLPALERAAAIAHRVYVSTASRAGWPLRVPETWSELDASARDYNIEAARTWIENETLLTAWLHAILEARLRA